MTGLCAPANPAVFAVVSGQPFTDVPADLFIPPDALDVLLDTFHGPLDLLLYLIRQQHFDIMNIPIATVAKQYMQYIALLEERRLTLAADYLVMAAWLAEIKSRLLLPVTATDDSEGDEDPRLELVRRLQHYEQFKQAADHLEQLTRLHRDVFLVSVPVDALVLPKVLPDVSLSSLVHAMSGVLQQNHCITSHQVSREIVSVRERMVVILERLQQQPLVELASLLVQSEGRMGLVVTLLAALELAKQSLLVITQTQVYGVIFLGHETFS